MEAVRDRPRDMFTASGGTEGTDMCVVTLRAEELMYSLGKSPLNPGRQGGLTDKGGLQVLMKLRVQECNGQGGLQGVGKPV